MNNDWRESSLGKFHRPSVLARVSRSMVSANYHRSVKVWILLNKWLALTRLGSTGSSFHSDAFPRAHITIRLALGNGLMYTPTWLHVTYSSSACSSLFGFCRFQLLNGLNALEANGIYQQKAWSLYDFHHLQRCWARFYYISFRVTRRHTVDPTQICDRVLLLLN